MSSPPPPLTRWGDAPRPTEDCFLPTPACPFCRERQGPRLARVRYHDTALANPALPDVWGELRHCARCGVAYSSHACRPDAFPLFYQTSLSGIRPFNESILQRLRVRYLTEALRSHHAPLSPSRLLDALSLFVFSVPLVTRRPRGLRMLDVGCGFGEFMSIYRSLGNEVTGTEVAPGLVDRLAARGFDCRLGEIGDIAFGGARFDAIIVRAVLYRVADPAATLRALACLLAPGGEIALVDPCPTPTGTDFFFKRQFPQGRFYICDRDAYFRMLRERLGLRCVTWRQIYGRPDAALRRARPVDALLGALELAIGNLIRVKPYLLSYTLEVAA